MRILTSEIGYSKDPPQLWLKINGFKMWHSDSIRKVLVLSFISGPSILINTSEFALIEPIFDCKILTSLLGGKIHCKELSLFAMASSYRNFEDLFSREHSVTPHRPI